ncbi:MAG TPA: ATPase domain-containing protein [Candidatus Nanoarchaeia archaeon]|nr:ATPase domain-containing protein [Candidatus Nanoarchaeia archaeon]
MKRIKTGIKGFDELVQGGFPEGSSTLITGSPGTGKSIFGLQYIYNGAIKYKERGLYLTFEQRKTDMMNQAVQFGWDFGKLERARKAEILAIPITKVTHETIEMLKEKMKKEKIKRLVVDSLTALTVNAPIYAAVKDMAIKDIVSESTVLSPPIVGDFLVKHFIYSFIESLQELEDVTSILISENSSEPGFLSRDTVSEFACDGVVVINFESLGGEYSRTLIVRKMRQTKNDENVHPLEVSDKGLVVHELK